MRHTTRTLAIAAALMSLSAPAVAQERTLTDAFTDHWTRITEYVVKAAEGMPEADYGFKLTPSVRSFGEVVAHIADTSYGICASAIGDKERSFGNAEKTMSRKADIVRVLKDAFAYCDAQFGKLNDQTARERTSSMGDSAPRLATLAFNTNHTWEHYGNLVTYLRIKNLVPPSSSR